ncbi:reverse transcriptase domain-containing protein [Tanacetum coccineum]
MQEGKSRVETWLKMKKLLQEKFLPVNLDKKLLDYHNLTHRNTSVEDFIAEFDPYGMRCGVAKEEEQVISHFFGCLRPYISAVVQLLPYWSFADVCRLALKVEK